MITFVFSKDTKNNYQDIVSKNSYNKTIIITSSNNVVEYKKYFNDYENILVIDLKTFIYKIYNENISILPILDSNSQILYFNKAIRSVSDRLTLLNKYNLDIIDDLITLYKNETDNLLVTSNYKTEMINDINLIFKEYLELIKDKYIDSSLLYKEVLCFLKENKILSDTNVVVSDITYLNNIEKEIVKELCNNSNHAYLYFLTESNVPGIEIHSDMVNYFKESFKNNYDNYILDNGLGLEKEHIMNNLYNLNNEVFNKSKYISLYGGSDLYDEVVFVAKKINEYVRTKGMRYRDFAIVSNSINDYENYFDLIFSDNHIFYQKKNNLNHYFFNYVLDLLDIIINGVSQDSLIKILKTKYYNISDYNINTINNNEEINNELQEYINNVILKPLQISNETKVRSFLKNLYSYLETFNINSKINIDNSDTWTSFIKILDSVDSVYGEESLNLTMLKDTFKYMFNKVSTNTNYLDEVLVGDTSIINTLNPKVVFFIGVNEGVVPKKFSSNILINNLELSKYYLNYPKFNDVLIDKLNTFLAILSPSDQIFVTYHKVSKNGSKTNPSPIIKKLKDMYQDVNVIRADEQVYNISLPNLTYTSFLTYDNENLKKQLKDYFNNNEDYKKFNNLIDNIPRFYNVSNLSNLQLDKLSLSASSIDSYNYCNFKYFCQYILNLKEKETLVYDNRIVGTYIHYMFEKLISSGATRDNINGLLKFWKQEFTTTMELKLTKTIDYMFGKLNDSINELWKIIYDDINENKFKPKYLELNMSESKDFYQLVLKYLDVPIYLRGIIDRVDLNNNYVRVIDYKTGSKEINLNDIINGLNLQLFIYLLYLKKANKNLIPSGMFYMPSLVKYDSNGFSNKGYRLSGMILNDTEVINSLGGENINNYIDAYTRDKFKENVLIEPDDLDMLLEYTEKSINKTAKNILSGQIEIKPFKEKKLCQYCPYQAICGIEENSKNYKKLIKYDKSEIWSAIRRGIDEMD
ncbi:MAG: PD-(D/E)XK nuclease family protein [Bacilli bacterium]